MEIIDQSEDKSQSFTLNIPEEILHYDILTRVPAKSLLRFKSVCKYWYTLINSSTFINIHQKFSVESRSNDNSSDYFIVSKEFGNNTCVLTYIDDHNSTRVGNVKIENVDNRNFSIMGSCNGLICLNLNNYSGFKLCNPLTREFSNLIERPRYNIGTIAYQYAFGYNSVGRDYKIVIVTSYKSYNNPRLHCGVQVYSTRVDSWKQTDEFSHNFCLVGEGETLNNKLHWIVLKDREKDDSNKHDILTFDLHTEKFGGISYSTKLIMNKPDLWLMVLKWRLCTVTRNVTTGGIRIWMMNEYGVSESWMKLYELEHGKVCFMNFPKVIYGSRMNFEEVLATKRIDKENLQYLEVVRRV
ncbi:hypothetical protein RND81_12G149800 [Saponaria officinalis]|uniref:F-box domain-containing protein n=1 Tax=Saponaria officinalis TaxID=3572 RepID=A0AAW1HAV7_SAPOF